MQDGGVNLLQKARDIRGQSNAPLLNSAKNLKQDSFQDDKMQDVSNKMEGAVKQEQAGYFEQVFETIKQPFKTFDTSLTEFSKGNIAEGIGKLITTGLETVGAVISPISVGSEKIANMLPEDVKNLGMSKDVADAINYNLTQPISSGAGALDIAFNKVLPDTLLMADPKTGQPFLASKKDILNLGVPESVVNALNPPIRSVGDLAVQVGLFKKLEGGLKSPEYKPLYKQETFTNRQGKTFSENPTQSTNPKLLDQPKRFTSSEVGDSKIVPTPQEQLAISKSKLALTELNNKALELNNKAEILTEQLKNKKTKANKEAVKKVNEELEDINALRDAEQSQLDYFANDLKQRSLKGALEQDRGTFGSGVAPLGKGENAPSNVGFSLPKEKIVEVGNENKPLQGAPVKKSVHDYLVNRGLDLFKMVKADKPLDSGVLGDVLRQARDKGVYEEVLNTLKEEAFKRGKTLEFETALKNTVEKVDAEIIKPAELSDGIKISEIKDTTPVTSTVEQIKKAQEIVGKDTFEQVATEISKDKEPFLQGVFTEELANKIVDAGKLPDEYISKMYHGSSKKFDAFDFDKVKTGDDRNLSESGMAWGIYTADSPRRGAYYSEKLSGKDKSNAYIYEIEKPLNAEIMQWDNTATSQQAKQIASALRRSGKTDGIYNKIMSDLSEPILRGSDIYNALKKELGSQKAASLLLKDAKIDATEIKNIVTDKVGNNKSGSDYVWFNTDKLKINSITEKSSRIISEELNKKADDILRENLGNVSANPLGNYKLYEALVIKGAYHLENGVIRFSQWSKKMIEENGEKIRPALMSIWNEVQKNAKLVNAGEITNLKDKINKQTNPVEISNTVKDYFKVDTANMNEKQKKSYDDLSATLGKQLKTFFENKNIDKPTQDAVLETVNKMSDAFGGKKYSSSELTYIRSLAFDKASQLSKAYGSHGGEWFNKSFKGSTEFGQIMQEGHNVLNAVQEIKQKTGKTFDNSYGKVVDALQDRTNANKILEGDKTAQQVYPLMEQFFDTMKKRMEDKGYKVEEDYYFRMHKQKMFNDFFAESPKLEDMGTAGIENFYTVNSKFLKQRIKDTASNIRTDFNAVYNYLNSTARELAYKDLRDYTSKDFITGVKGNKLLSQNFTYLRDALENLTNPERVGGKNWRTVEKIKGGIYTAFLWNNPKLAIVNYYQKLLADGYITPEATKLATQIYREKYQPTGRLFDAITETKADAPAYLGENTYTWDKGKFRQWAEKYDIFRLSESSNWNYSEGAGVINSVMRQTGAKTFEAIEKALTDQKVFDKAVNEARDLSARTQVSPDAAFRPLLYDKAYSRLALMFTRYPLAMTDLMINSVFKKLEGTDGLRAQNILRRGLSEETAPVEMLRSVEYMRKNLELALKEVKKDRYEPPASKQVMQSYVDFLKSKEVELNKVIKTLEPLDKTRISKQWAKYIGISAGVSFAYKLFENELWDAVGLNKDQRKKSLGQHIANTMIDTSPIPIFRVASGDMLQPPIMPSIDLLIYGNFSGQNVTRQTLDYLSTITPGVNTATQLFRRFTGVTPAQLGAKEIFGSGNNNSGVGIRGGR